MFLLLLLSFGDGGDAWVSSSIAVEFARKPGAPGRAGIETIAQSSALASFSSPPGEEEDEGEKGAHFVETRCQRAHGTQPALLPLLLLLPPLLLLLPLQSPRKSGKQLVELRVALDPG